MPWPWSNTRRKEQESFEAWRKSNQPPRNSYTWVCILDILDMLGTFA
jgi:hypothetical protein